MSRIKEIEPKEKAPLVLACGSPKKMAIAGKSKKLMSGILAAHPTGASVVQICSIQICRFAQTFRFLILR
ncbi:hypothetical protein [Methylophaga pinxianii]|uniref:hypothetical protein n=1 Tax=Methylophaga pinxianii TaxID=2881052 RepID=UPI001FFB996E|nr:hypothetical protein [Methylophaga pinxianii]MCB2426909.1 hypothetical protein [Methylophaga pinxianii]UPH45673.1 hypothetical protein LGT42_014385 [Methylophaga pinxianii]